MCHRPAPLKDAAAPSFGTDGGVPYMIYEAGERLAGAIAVARG